MQGQRDFRLSGGQKPPGRHLIGSRPPAPFLGHYSAGCTRFWLLTPPRVPDPQRSLPDNGRATRLQQPAHTSTRAGRGATLHIVIVALRYSGVLTRRVRKSASERSPLQHISAASRPQGSLVWTCGLRCVCAGVGIAEKTLKRSGPSKRSSARVGETVPQRQRISEKNAQPRQRTTLARVVVRVVVSAYGLYLQAVRVE